MDTKQEQMDIIDILETNELLIARLYMAFAEHFPDHRIFWNEMAEDEKKHASMVRTLEQEIREGSLHFNKDRFDTTSIKMLHDYVKVWLSKAKKEIISLDSAFESALAVEHDLIEMRVFEIFDSDSPELRIILEALTSATKEHRRRLTGVLEKYKKSRP
jgi:rubrerythrin